MRQLYRYLTVGVVMTVLGYCAIYFCMYVLGWGAILSNVAVYAVAILCSYYLNRKFTFESKHEWRSEAGRFFGVFALAYSTNLLALKVLIDVGVHDGLSQILAGVFYVAISFAANKRHVFKA